MILCKRGCNRVRQRSWTWSLQSIGYYKCVQHRKYEKVCLNLETCRRLPSSVWHLNAGNGDPKIYRYYRWPSQFIIRTKCKQGSRVTDETRSPRTPIYSARLVSLWILSWVLTYVILFGVGGDGKQNFREENSSRDGILYCLGRSYVCSARLFQKCFRCWKQRRILSFFPVALTKVGKC